MRAMRPLCAAMCVSAGVLFVSPAWCDTLGPLLPARVMQAGITWRQIERTVGYTPEFETVRHDETLDQNDISVFGRYGLTSNATLAFELSATPGEVVFDDSDGTLYVAGAALQLGIWTNQLYALSFGFHYGSMYWRNDSNGPDIEETLLEWSVLLQRSWEGGIVDGVVWTGPIASHLAAVHQLPGENEYMETEEMYGVLIGANARFYQSAGIETQLLWIETAELHVALFWQF